MTKNKADRIIDLHVDSNNAHTRDKGKWIASALYVSSLSTDHFYEALEFLSEVYPDQYLEEFEVYKSKFNI